MKGEGTAEKFIEPQEGAGKNFYNKGPREKKTKVPIRLRRRAEK